MAQIVNAEEQKLYLEARNRAIARLTDGNDFFEECIEAFRDGLKQEREIEKENYLPETNDGFSAICGLLTVVQARKGKSYAASWQKRGMAGAFTNLQRKYDRIDNIINVPETAKGENLVSQLADQAVYSILMLSLQVQLHPEELEQWLAEVASL